MMKKAIIAIEVLTLLGGTLLLQGCFFEEDHPYPAYGSYDYPAYGYYESGPTVVYRDADEHPHHWWQHEQREERAERPAERREEHPAERRERHHDDHDRN